MGGFGVSRGTPAECSKPGRCVDGEMRNCEAKKAQDSDADQSCSGCQTPAERRRPGRRPLPRAERGLPYRSESPGDWHIVHRGHTNRFMPGPVRWFRAVIAAVGIFASGTACLGQTQQRYPGTSWQQLTCAVRLVAQMARRGRRMVSRHRFLGRRCRATWGDRGVLGRH